MRLPVSWALLHRRAILGEAVLARLGPVEVRLTQTRAVAFTVVKGEPAGALQTALRRLANYTGRDNREGIRVAAAGPVGLRPDAPGRWRTEIGLSDVPTLADAPLPRDSKIRLSIRSTETLAIMRLSGRPGRSTLSHGEHEVRAAIVGSGWVAAGAPEYRLNAGTVLFPWTGGLEIAVPLTAL